MTTTLLIGRNPERTLLRKLLTDGGAIALRGTAEHQHGIEVAPR